MAHQQKLKDTTRNLAKFTTDLAKETQDELNKLHRLVRQQNEVIGAMVRLLGPDAVENAVTEMREEAQSRLLEQQKQGVAYLVEQKVMVPAEVVTHPEGFIIGTDKLADGSERRVQFEMAGINPEFIPLYLGKKVGDTVEGNGSTLTITEIYSVDRKHYEELMSQPPAAALPPAADAPPALPMSETSAATTNETAPAVQPE